MQRNLSAERPRRPRFLQIKQRFVQQVVQFKNGIQLRFSALRLINLAVNVQLLQRKKVCAHQQAINLKTVGITCQMGKFQIQNLIKVLSVYEIIFKKYTSICYWQTATGSPKVLKFGSTPRPGPSGTEILPPLLLHPLRSRNRDCIYFIRSHDTFQDNHVHLMFPVLAVLQALKSVAENWSLVGAMEAFEK